MPPPISPIMTMASVSLSFINNSTASFVVVPMMGSPPMPTAVEIPRPAFATWSAASYVSVPDFDTIPIFPFLKTKPGMMPTLHSSAVMTPGQLGPISLAFLPARKSFTFTISCTGMPSVMQTISSTPASAASMMASPAKAGGTKMMETLAPACFTQSATVLNTLRSRCVVPPLPGVTPPTTLVPYSIIWEA